jgi:hypothetical protein
VMYILDGTATIVTGGDVVGGKTSAPGEIRGQSIRGGKEQRLSKGRRVRGPERRAPLVPRCARADTVLRRESDLAPLKRPRRPPLHRLEASHASPKTASYLCVPPPCGRPVV